MDLDRLPCKRYAGFATILLQIGRLHLRLQTPDPACLHLFACGCMSGVRPCREAAAQVCSRDASTGGDRPITPPAADSQREDPSVGASKRPLELGRPLWEVVSWNET
jgi:hypothetical protein